MYDIFTYMYHEKINKMWENIPYMDLVGHGIVCGCLNGSKETGSTFQSYPFSAAKMGSFDYSLQEQWL